MEEMKENKKSKVAVALKYEMGDEAPEIVATGKGELADKIINKAREANVPTYEDGKLANTLLKLEVGELIPPELYGVVAEILVFVDNMDKLKKNK